MNEFELPVVDILMATYNGEKYLKDQINSILYQTYKNWRLIIRDDNSSDRTTEIINNYADLDPRIIICNDDKGNLGVFKNFMELISISDSPYIMFADQDDIWINDKVEVSLKFIRKVEKENSPTLVFSNSILMNEGLTKKFGFNYRTSFKPELTNFLFYNAGYQGAAMIFNIDLKKKIFPFFDNCPVHDYHISLVGLLLGNVFYIDRPLMLYRRHEKATTVQNLTILSRLRWVLKKKSFIYDVKMLHYLKAFSKHYESTIPERKKKIIEEYFLLVSNELSMFRKARIVMKSKFTLRGSTLYLIFKLFSLK
ncbi:glycosyltransferase family 2 protein [Flavobacterium artemisiae]|uniref:Glycosyltransferase family 2 protein n=1 Tax=Flavobacterium artemisiae TaxID=2126556 RepID=A0ABW4H8M6_9FLAO